ncbi:MAG TPA: glycine--tRNA ligase subunit beta [Candidatus Acidoferrales bacterium]|nr:glycine--tRNA ligase subunit beta [Candidatus Acidoferrales bacterium]
MSSLAGPARADLLFEIGCEEIPAGMILKASQDLKVILAKQLAGHALVDESTVEASIETFGAPRRLVAIAKNIRVQQQDVTRDVMGPPKSVAYDGTGEPTRAAQSFAEKQGIALSKLVVVDTPKGEYVAARVTIAGKEASKILGEILPEAIREISWPRSMVWTGAHGPRFIRPIRWIVATLGGKMVACTYADVQSGRRTEGHRFLGKRDIDVQGPKDYQARLRTNCVLCRPEDRRRKIEAELKRITARKGLRPHGDPTLLEMVTYLNEYPTVIWGDFDPAFLVLPEEILITVMRGHQKYFAVENRKGQLAPHFLAVINLPQDPKGLVRQGHERVLRARFADAQFFWRNDQKIQLVEYLPKLRAVTYERRLGSYADKVERLRWLARWLSEQWVAGGVAHADIAGADRAAELAKCDLVTGMVREFTELQGAVGGLYALAQGEPEEIAWAVYDHYKPLGLDDPLPRNLAGSAVALADKLDSLMACFAVGEIPTGSSDPFALRRAALGIVKIILEQKLPLSLSAAISAAAKSLREHAPNIAVSEAVESETANFLLERARYILKERRDYAYDEINAAFAAGADDLGDAVERIAALRAIRRSKDFGPLAASFKRIRNILEKSAGTGDKVQEAVDPSILKEVGELQLFTVAQQIGREATLLKKEGKYRRALEKISSLRPAVDFFFDKVLVMSEDQRVRRNRIALLRGLLKEFSTIADFSELGAEEVS